MKYDETKNTNNYTIQFIREEALQYGNILQFFEFGKTIYAYVEPYETINISFNQPDAAVRKSFNNIHKFFRKIESKKQRIFIKGNLIVTKCILMSMFEGDHKIQIITPCVDLDEHD
jgi:hypothetical protein